MMVDLVDSAQKHEHRLRQEALARAAARHPGTGRAECAECGEPIPPERRSAVPHAETCVDCQRDRERT